MRAIKSRREALRGLLAVGAWTLLPAGARAAVRRIRVGVLPGPDARVMEVVQGVAEVRDLPIELVILDDHTLVRALRAGRIDAGAGLDLHALEAGIEPRDRSLVAAATTITLPLGVYSRRIRALRALTAGDELALPSAPSDTARALILLHNCGLLRLRDGAGLAARPADVVANPRGLRLLLVEPGQLQGSLERAVASAMTYPVAAAAGLEPARDSIAMEDGRSPWAHVLATRARDRGAPWVATLVRACHSDEVRDFILAEFRDSVRRAW